VETSYLQGCIKAAKSRQLSRKRKSGLNTTAGSVDIGMAYDDMLDEEGIADQLAEW
jgi:hypothetical protein